MSRSTSPIGQLSPPRNPERVTPARTSSVDALEKQLGAAAATLASTGPGIQEDALDDVADRLRDVEALLDELAGAADVTSATARQLRSLRDGVSVHLSAAASLRLLDLDANAAVVLRRAVDSVRVAVASPADLTHPMPVYDTG